ncbi:unnamed protein product, partial [Ectocarpus sp. 12 AP-2014]
VGNSPPEAFHGLPLLGPLLPGLLLSLVVRARSRCLDDAPACGNKQCICRQKGGRGSRSSDFLAGGCGCRRFPQTHPTSGKYRHPVRFSRETNMISSESMYMNIKKKVQTEQWIASERSALGQT